MFLSGAPHQKGVSAEERYMQRPSALLAISFQGTSRCRMSKRKTNHRMRKVEGTLVEGFLNGMLCEGLTQSREPDTGFVCGSVKALARWKRWNVLMFSCYKVPLCRKRKGELTRPLCTCTCSLLSWERGHLALVYAMEASRPPLCP